VSRRSASPRLDLSRHVEGQVHAADGEGHLGGQRAGFQLAARGGSARRPPDLAPRGGDADLLEFVARCAGGLVEL